MNYRRLDRLQAVALLLLCPLSAQAGCLTDDAWHGQDKVFHASMGFAVSTGMTVHTRDPWQGFAWGVGVGAAKEVFDLKVSQCTFQDFAVTAIGAGLGAVVGNWSLRINPDGKGAAVIYRMDLR